MTSSPAVDVLRCPGCGAGVSIGPSDEAKCTQCGQTVPIPQEHRALRLLQREQEVAHQRAKTLFSKLDSPPWLATRVFAAVFDQPMFVFWIFFGVPVGLVSIFAGLAVDARIHPPPVATVGVVFTMLFVLTFLPRSVGIYANRRAGARSLLVAGLAARSPQLPGGPAHCRGCGAPLDVPAGAVVARCAHCGVESAVHIRTPFLARTRRATRATVHTIEQAAAIDRDERAATRRTVARELGRYVLAISVFGGLFAIWTWDYERVRARDDGAAPAFGIAALVVATFLLIAMFLRSAGSDNRGADEARQRRTENGLPGWVRTVGPFGFWGVLWFLRWAIWR